MPSPLARVKAASDESRNKSGRFLSSEGCLYCVQFCCFVPSLRPPLFLLPGVSMYLIVAHCLMTVISLTSLCALSPGSFIRFRSPKKCRSRMGWGWKFLRPFFSVLVSSEKNCFFLFFFISLEILIFDILFVSL